MASDFKTELTELLNKHSKENGSDTPDYLLADYLIQCMDVFDKIIIDRDKWYGRSRNDSVKAFNFVNKLGSLNPNDG